MWRMSTVFDRRPTRTITLDVYWPARTVLVNAGLIRLAGFIRVMVSSTRSIHPTSPFHPSDREQSLCSYQNAGASHIP